jgi:Ca2+-binding RTX toxin-like protein
MSASNLAYKIDEETSHIAYKIDEEANHGKVKEKPHDAKKDDGKDHAWDGKKDDDGKEHDYGHGKTIYGTKKDDWLYGTKHDDVIKGDKGNDHIYGKGGNDKLYGDKGADDLYGGKGNDKLWGGDGKDTFHFDKHDNGYDTVFDFDVKKDSLDFGGAKDIDYKDDGKGNTIASWDDGSVKLTGVDSDHFGNGHSYDWM